MKNILEMKSGLVNRPKEVQLSIRIRQLEYFYGSMAVDAINAFKDGKIFRLEELYYESAILTREKFPGIVRYDFFERQIRSLFLYFGLPTIEKYLNDTPQKEISNG